MKLKHLLDNQKWEEDDFEYNAKSITRMMRSDVERSIKKLFRHYYVSIALNVVFLLVTIAVYFIMPSRDILLPIVIIASPFLVMLVQVIRQLHNRTKTDHNSDLKTVLEETLRLNANINSWVCDVSGIIFTLSFIGGFLLGLIVQGWTIYRMINKPILLIVMIVLTSFVFWMSRSRKFLDAASRLNPGYLRTKKYLEERLKELKEE